ncbi:MAG: RNA polymerase sigma factor [Planctomycetota bacterium]
MRRKHFERLALGYLDLVYETALRICADRARAEDLSQETYRLAFERWHTLRDPGACRAWLLRILRNVHVDEIRRTRHLVAIEGDATDLADPTPLGDPGRTVLARLTLERLEQVLETLSPEARWLFVLREVDGLSYQEVSQVLDIPIGTVRSRIARLRSRLLAGLVPRREGEAHHRRERRDES